MPSPSVNYYRLLSEPDPARSNAAVSKSTGILLSRPTPCRERVCPTERCHHPTVALQQPPRRSCGRRSAVPFEETLAWRRVWGNTVRCEPAPRRPLGARTAAAMKSQVADFCHSSNRGAARHASDFGREGPIGAKGERMSANLAARPAASRPPVPISPPYSTNPLGSFIKMRTRTRVTAPVTRCTTASVESADASGPGGADTLPDAMLSIYRSRSARGRGAPKEG
jgi:hypothetical protein